MEDNATREKIHERKNTDRNIVFYNFEGHYEAESTKKHFRDRFASELEVAGRTLIGALERPIMHGNRITLFGLAPLVASRSSDHLLDVIQDKPGVGLSKDELGFKEFHQIRETLRRLNAKILPVCLSDIIVMRETRPCAIHPHGESAQYMTDWFVSDPTSAKNDLKRIVEGPEEVDWADHALVGCEHAPRKHKEELSWVINCRACFIWGYLRAVAVASGAYCFSKNESYQFQASTLSFNHYFSVLFETDIETERQIHKDYFHLYGSEAISAALRYLSIHSADVDPRMICVNPDLYWSIIWHYGSVTKALKEAGGQRLYDIGFGRHDFNEIFGMKNTKVKDVPRSLIRLFKDVHDGSTIFSPKLSRGLISDNFVSKLINKKMELRYCCNYRKCNKLEDTKKFLNCRGCKELNKRRYCSEKCQVEDWDVHQHYCQSQSQHSKGSDQQTGVKSKQRKKRYV